MGSCSTKRISKRAYSGEIVKIKNQLTPSTSESSNLHHFPSHFSKPDSILSHFFEAFGSFPSRFDKPFAPKPIEFRGSGDVEMLTSAKLCVTSRKGLKEGVNQDNFCVVSNPSFFAMAVFDGHVAEVKAFQHDGEAWVERPVSGLPALPGPPAGAKRLGEA